MPSALSPAQIYQYALTAGFPPDTAVKMTAIALRESSGIPTAFNGDLSTGDQSYGLWQINMINKPGNQLGVARLAQFGLSTYNQLFDPATNARAAYIIWAGNDANLSAAWYIDRYGTKYQYAERYDSLLPTAYAAAQEVLSPEVFANLTPPDEENDTTGLLDAISSLDTGTMIAGGVGIAALIWVAMR